MWQWLWIFFRWKYGTIIRSIEVLFYYYIWKTEFENTYREKEKENINMKDGYKLEDTIILNGKVGWVNTGDDADSIIGIQNIQKVKRFSGEEIVVSNDGFAFSKEMESRCGWLDRYASIQMLTGDTPIDMDHIDETKIVSMEGITQSDYYHRYSDYSGYLWTEEEFKCGGHDLLKILEGNMGKYIHIEIELYSRC